ncbi:MAG: N-acetylneuraminate synthase [Acidobacteriota bacterium]|nr:N-acetylneuraminate synthase [Acidobacteriota bacterium]
MLKPIEIAGRQVGPGAPCFVIAEVGVNHNGSSEKAKQLVDAARAAGADAVKFQTFQADEVVSPAAAKAKYQIEATGEAGTQLEMVQRLELSPEAFAELATHCRALGILFLSTPFDPKSADLLDGLGVPAFKVASGEITNWPFLEYLVRKGKPMIVSTGMSEMDEVKSAVEVIRRAGNTKLALLHCVSDYPAAATSANLRAMHTMAQQFQVPIGFSDHTLGIEVALAAVALGACIIEKHLTLDRDLPGPDHRASLPPDEFAALVRGIRLVESALGDGRKRRMPEEEDTARVARRSLVAACALPAGTVVEEQHVAILRPGTGMPPAQRARLIGRRALHDIAPGTLLTLEMFS